MQIDTRSREELLRENELLYKRLEALEEIVQAIKRERADPAAIEGTSNGCLYSLEGPGCAYLALMEGISEGAVVLSADGTVLYGNRCLEEMTEVPLEKILGQSILRNIAQGDHVAFQALLQRGLQHDAKGELRFTRVDSTAFPVEVSMKALRVEGSPVLCMVITDLSDRAQRRRELAQYRSQFEEMAHERTRELMKAKETAEKRAAEAEEAKRILRALMEYIPEGIAIADASDMTVRMMSKYMQEQSGSSIRMHGQLSLDEYARQWDIFHADGIRPAKAEELPLVRATRGETVKGEEWVLYRPDATMVTILCDAGPIRDSNGEVTGGIVAWRDITERKKMEENLRQAHEQLEFRIRERTAQLEASNRALLQSDTTLRRLSASLLHAQEEERKRVATELHDSIGSSLSAIKFSLENLHGKRERSLTDSIEAMISMTRQTIDEVRRIMTDLRPSMLDDLGLLDTIQWFCKRFASVYSHIYLELFVEVEEADVPKPLKIVVFRVLQEALHNVAKHSRAEYVELYLRKKDGFLQLAVEDSGIGFELNCLSDDNSERGLGLASMKERVELSGGNFTIESRPGEGTLISGLWPISSAQSDFGFMQFEEDGECQEEYQGESAIPDIGAIGTKPSSTEPGLMRLTLSRQAEILRTIIDHIPVMLCFYDSNGHFLLLNREFERLLGWSIEDLSQVDDAMAAFYPDPKMREEVWVFMMEATPGWRDFTVRRRDGGCLESSWANVRLSDNSQIGIGIDITERKEFENALQRSERQLRHLSSRLLVVQEEERALVARELHDTISQNLSVIKYCVENALSEWDESQQYSLKSVIPLVQNAIEDVRKIYMGLRPSMLDDFGVIATLKWLCREFQSIYPATEIEQNFSLREEHVPADIKLVIFRLAQQALENIAQHSNAEYCTLYLGRENECIRFVVEDEGVGFDMEDARILRDHHRGIGLASMKERTELSGGAFTIRSVLGEGTRIEASWPGGNGQ